jgi:hypothetical protein
MARGRSFGAINLRQVPLRLREQFRALCALRGTTMTRRLLELIEADVQRAHDSGEYLPVITRTLDEEVRVTGQGELWPEATPPE